MISILEQGLALLNQYLRLLGLGLLVRRPVFSIEYAHDGAHAAVQTDAQFLGKLMQASLNIVKSLQPFRIRTDGEERHRDINHKNHAKEAKEGHSQITGTIENKEGDDRMQKFSHYQASHAPKKGKAQTDIPVEIKAELGIVPPFMMKTLL